LSWGLTAVCLFASACLSNPSRHYYQIQPDTPSAPNRQKTELGLLVLPVAVDEFYDNYRIAYRLSPYALNHYIHHLWYKKPAEMFGDELQNHARSKGIFSMVFDRLAEGNPDYSLSCRVLAVEEGVSGRLSRARLSMELSLKNFRSEKEVLRHRFDRSEPITGRRINDLVRTLSRIFSQELDHFFAQALTLLTAEKAPLEGIEE
jgi:ABC-type uncharacterized transport system auxiliary subunit